MQRDMIDQGGMLVIEFAALGCVMIDCCWSIDMEYVKTSVTDIQHNLSNTMTGEGEEQQGLHNTR